MYPSSAFHSYSIINDYNNNHDNGESLKRDAIINSSHNTKCNNFVRVDTSNLVQDIKKTVDSKTSKLSDSLKSDILQMKQNYVTLNINSMPSSPSRNERLAL